MKLKQPLSSDLIFVLFIALILWNVIIMGFYVAVFIILLFAYSVYAWKYAVLNFRQDKLEVSFPFRFSKRIIDYKSIRKYRIGGSYLEPTQLVLYYEWNEKIKKVAAPLPNDHKLHKINIILGTHNSIQIKKTNANST